MMTFFGLPARAENPEPKFSPGRNLLHETTTFIYGGFLANPALNSPCNHPVNVLKFKKVLLWLAEKCTLVGIFQNFVSGYPAAEYR